MEKQWNDYMIAPVQAFRLPAYEEIPEVGLYLEQTIKYINRYLAPFPEMALTASMVSNYVKKGVIPGPVKKQYGRDQIASLLFVAVAKVAMSMEDIAQMFGIQAQTYSYAVAYAYFRSELENVLHYVFGLKDSLDYVGKESTQAKTLLRNLIIAVAHKLYLEQYLSILKAQNRDQS